MPHKIPLIGYASRLSGRPGDSIDFKVSSDSSEPFEASLIRIHCADPNPDGPGLIHEDVPAAFEGRYPSRRQDYALGSYVRIAHGGRLPALQSFTLVATVWPTTPDKGLQGVIGACDESLSAGVALCIGEDGSACVRLGSGRGEPVTLSAGPPLKARRWYRIWASYDARSGRLTVGQAALDGVAPAALASVAAEPARATALSDPILIAALGAAQPRHHFNGKIEAPMILGEALDAEALAALTPADAAPRSLACWDFSRGISTLRVEDIGPGGHHGEIVNLPARAMTGASWRGQEMCWRHAPEHYGAIHFHDDDFYDCAWATDFSFTIPEDLRSGVYAARLRCGPWEDNIPFFVCPPKGEKQAELCVVIPTFTYVIYSDNGRYDFGPALKEKMAAWGAYPWNPAEHPDFGQSAYNLHSDGSGVCHVSSRRPLLTLKSGYLTLTAPGSGSGLRHFQADSHLFAWLRHQGIDFDVVTDQELHDEGSAVLTPYRAVLTTTHPEYHTAESLDAFLGYREAGARLGYLGGNGFYWRIALHAEAPGAIEIRRGEGGLRLWAAEPGEYYHAFDGAYGGLWRRNGRPPQAIAGLGFSAQGTFIGSYFRRTPESYDPQVSWIFEGIDDEIVGDFGLCGGGAAGYELDRADPALGSPDDLVVVARSEKHAASYMVVPEEILSHVATVTGESHEELIRADMSYFETPSGGAVFSTGSITFCGSLPSNGFDNNISRLLLNVVKRFLEPDGALRATGLGGAAEGKRTAPSPSSG